MRICFSINDISLCGGTERMCLMIANELSKHGYDIYILSMQGSCRTFFPKEERVKIHRTMSRLEMLKLGTHPKYIIFKQRILYRWIHPDVVIDCDLPMSNLTIPAIKGGNIKHIAWDNFSYAYFKMVSHEHKALEKIKSNGSHIITLTKRDRDLYISEQGVEACKIHQICNPLTFNKDTMTSHNKKVVISVGRFAHEKGFDMLLKAWEIVERAVDDWSLEIWGDTGEDTGDVWKTYNSLDLKRASLHPATSEISEKYKEASIYVLPSRHEGFGLVLLEASVMSLPLIAFDCPNGPREIVKDGVNGFLVEANNIESLAYAIIRLIKDDEARKRMGKSAFEMSKSFSLEKIANQWQELFENL